MPYEVKLAKSAVPSTDEPTSIAIVVSDYNDNITGKLAKAAVETLIASEIRDEDIFIVHVPGAWELVYATQQMISRSDCRGVIALGAVIKGETSHDQHINRAVSLGLMQLSLEHGNRLVWGS